MLNDIKVSLFISLKKLYIVIYIDYVNETACVLSCGLLNNN